MTLNTIYFLIDEENEEAIEAVELLSDLLRYQLYDINTKVTIEEEIDYLRTYIQFQRLRMTKRLQFEESFDPELTGQKYIRCFSFHYWRMRLNMWAKRIGYKYLCGKRGQRSALE